MSLADDKVVGVRMALAKILKLNYVNSIGSSIFSSDRLVNNALRKLLVDQSADIR